MPFASNTSPLIAFSRIDRLDVLRSIAPRLLIPQAVSDELHRGARPDEPIITALAESDWIEILQVAESPLLKLLKSELGDGEAETLALGLHLNVSVIIDDRDGRLAAARLGADYLGVLGILRHAKRREIIPAVSPLVAALLSARIYYTEALITRFLREEGET